MAGRGRTPVMERTAFEQSEQAARARPDWVRQSMGLADMIQTATRATSAQLLKNGCALSGHQAQAQLAQLPPIDTGSQVAPLARSTLLRSCHSSATPLAGFARWALTTRHF